MQAESSPTAPARVPAPTLCHGRAERPVLIGRRLLTVMCCDICGSRRWYVGTDEVSARTALRFALEYDRANPAA